jgi:tyrosine-protein phosphatase YwqE
MTVYHKDFFINRLVKEWLEHERLIVACDLDDTIIPYNKELTESCKETVELLKECQQEGITLIINTARKDHRLAESSLEVIELGLNPASINEMPKYWSQEIGISGKVYANIFLDDRGGLECSRHQLKKAFEIVKFTREQQQIKINI